MELDKTGVRFSLPPPAAFGRLFICLWTIYFVQTGKVKLEKKRIRPSQSEVLRLCSSTEKSRKILNWKSSIRSKNHLKIKLYKTIEWYLKNENSIKNNFKEYQI